MIIKLKLLGSLREQAPAEASQELSDHTMIADLLAQLNIAHERVQVVMINNQFEHDYQRLLNHGDEVSIIPYTFSHACDVKATA